MRLGFSKRAALVALACVALVACGGDDDGGGRTDAGRDGSTPDGALPDSTVPGGDAGTDAQTGTRDCRIAGGECDVIEQDCPMATHGCYVLSRGAGMPPTTLCDTAGTATDGMPCTTYGDCAPGLTCDQDQMVCRSYCCEGSTADCPAGSGQICISYSNAMPTGICDPPSGCSLIEQEGCAEGEGCYLVDPADGTADCRPVPDDAVAEGGTCGETEGPCAPGLLCITTEGAGSTCRKLCRTGMDDCTTGMCMTIGGLANAFGACL